MTFDFKADGGEANWLTDSTSVEFQERTSVVLFGPKGFEAYGRIMALPDPHYAGQRESEIDEQHIDAQIGDVELVRRAIETLRAATSTPDDLYFLFWEGWPFDPPMPIAGLVNVANMRNCVMAQGTARDWDNWIAAGVDHAYPPAFVWPHDRAWCIAFDVDAHFAGVGGSKQAFTLLTEGGHPVSRWERDVAPPMYR